MKSTIALESGSPNADVIMIGSKIASNIDAIGEININKAAKTAVIKIIAIIAKGITLTVPNIVHSSFSNTK